MYPHRPEADKLHCGLSLFFSWCVYSYPSSEWRMFSFMCRSSSSWLKPHVKPTFLGTITQCLNNSTSASLVFSLPVVFNPLVFSELSYAFKGVFLNVYYSALLGIWLSREFLGYLVFCLTGIGNLICFSYWFNVIL